MVLRVVVLCSMLDGNRRFGGGSCLRLHGRSSVFLLKVSVLLLNSDQSSQSVLLPFVWMQYVPPKRPQSPARMHGVRRQWSKPAFQSYDTLNQLMSLQNRNKTIFILRGPIVSAWNVNESLHTETFNGNNNSGEWVPPFRVWRLLLNLNKKFADPNILILYFRALLIEKIHKQL
jgi:hypothetical protein